MIKVAGENGKCLPLFNRNGRRSESRLHPSKLKIVRWSFVSLEPRTKILLVLRKAKKRQNHTSKCFYLNRIRLHSLVMCFCAVVRWDFLFWGLSGSLEKYNYPSNLEQYQFWWTKASEASVPWDQNLKYMLGQHLRIKTEFLWGAQILLSAAKYKILCIGGNICHHIITACEGNSSCLTHSPPMGMIVSEHDSLSSSVAQWGISCCQKREI